MSLDTEWDTYPHWYCEHGYFIGMGCPVHDPELDPEDLVGVGENDNE